MDDIREFESLKKTIECLRVKKISNEMEKKRLEEQKETLVKDIREKYGIEPFDVAAEIERLKNEFSAKMESLRQAVAECQKQMEGRY